MKNDFYAAALMYAYEQPNFKARLCSLINGLSERDGVLDSLLNGVYVKIEHIDKDAVLSFLKDQVSYRNVTSVIDVKYNNVFKSNIKYKHKMDVRFKSEEEADKYEKDVENDVISNIAYRVYDHPDYSYVRNVELISEDTYDNYDLENNGVKFEKL